MLKMSSQIETIVNAYKTLSKIPTITGGKLNNAANKITSVQSVRNIDKGKNSKYVYNYMLDDNLNVIQRTDFGVDVTNELLSAVSPKETFKAVIREEKDSKDAKKQYLEIWRLNAGLTNCIDLTALDIHGDVYADGEFGGLDWSQDETSVVYIAEKKLKKSEPYIKRNKAEDASKSGGGEPLPKKGEEYLYRQDWGEQLGGKILSVVVVCKIETEAFTILEGLPESWCPGQVSFAADGKSVVGVAWETEPRRLGLIFCTNRPSFVFDLTLDGQLTKLSAPGHAVRSPRLRPNGDVAWLQRAADGPHHACHALVIQKKGQTEVTPIIDIVQTEIATAQGKPFYGLYNQALPKNCFTKDGSKLVFSTPSICDVKTYTVDIDSGKIVELAGPRQGALSVLDLKRDVILASFSDMQTPAQLYVGKLAEEGKEQKWTLVSEPVKVPESLTNSTLHYLNHRHDNTEDAVKTFTSLYLAPRPSDKLPLIVWPHGGPHSGFVNAFSLEAAFFNMLGFAVLQINYRGSVGAGDQTVSFLPSRVGTADVADCKLATEDALRQFDIQPKRICLAGGSHGGFLVAHLSGQFPDTYCAVVSRNPVIDVASMFNSSDIPDWICLAGGSHGRFLVAHLSGQFPDTYCAVVSRNPVIDVAIMFNSSDIPTGFASLRINYRGSTGHGDANVRCLLSNAGRIDVEDCLLALKDVLERNIDTVSLFGGSYGGFIAAHLVGQYPDRFKSAVLRNPLVDMATKAHYADNSDGCAVEAGFPFTEKGQPSEQELLAMRRCSPVLHAHKVKAPTAFMLGRADKRVPHYQGLELARRLKANGVQTKVYMYDDNHSLSSLPHEMDQLINSASWLLEHLP